MDGLPDSDAVAPAKAGAQPLRARKNPKRRVPVFAGTTSGLRTRL